MVEKKIKDHKKHLHELTQKSNSNKADAIKELIDYLVLAHASGHAELILEKGIALVQRHPNFVKGENMYLVEEFFCAACELQQLDWAQFFLQMIRKQYPGSVKVMRMLSMFYEASGNPDKAQNILVDLIDQNPSDKQSVKRLVALYRDMQWSNEAIAVLNKFIETNQQDTEAWNELADIYMSKQNYAKAIHCFEELLFTQGKNYMVTLQYAELLYSTRRDRLDDLINARKYFMLSASTVSTEHQGNVRALFGVIKSTKAIQKLSKQPDEHGDEYIAAAQQQIREIYEEKGCPKAQAALNKMPLMQPVAQ